MRNKSKRYFWVRLCEDFFEKDEMKIIEGLENGTELIIFYLKLILKSVGNDGKLLIRDNIPYSLSMISRVTGTSVPFVEEGMEIFKEFGLIDILQENNREIYFLNDIEHMTGSETGYAKEKRERRSELLKMEDDENKLLDDELYKEIEDEESKVTRETAPLCADIVSKKEGNCPLENRDTVRAKDIVKVIVKDIEKRVENREESIENREEREEDREETLEMIDERERKKRIIKRIKKNIDKFNFPPMDRFMLDRLYKDCKEHREVCVYEAMEVAHSKGIKNYPYVKSILNNWKNEGKWDRGEILIQEKKSKFSNPMEDASDVESKF